VAKAFKNRKNFASSPVDRFKNRDIQIIAPVLEHLFDRIKIGSDEPKIQHEEPS
jgi:hypothetical protein